MTSRGEVGIMGALKGSLAIHRGEALFGSTEHRGVPPEDIGFRVGKGIRLEADCGGNGARCFVEFSGS